MGGWSKWMWHEYSTHSIYPLHPEDYVWKIYSQILLIEFSIYSWGMRRSEKKFSKVKTNELSDNKKIILTRRSGKTYKILL